MRLPSHSAADCVSGLKGTQCAVGETLYKLNPKDIAFGDAGDGYMFGGIQSRGNMDFDIFGDVFLKAVYVVCEWPPRF